MNVNRSELEKYLSEKFYNILFEKRNELDIYQYAYEKYNFPKGTFSDYVSGRKDISEASDFTLFIMLDSIKNNIKIGKSLDKYFTEREINIYSSSKVETNKIKFPLIFPMIQVSEDQWIGSIDVDTFYLMQNEGLINYNPDTQRAMTKVVRNQQETYRVTLNKHAVKEITSDLLEHIYIPDTITLNIPADEYAADFYYDTESKQLIVKAIKYFDINDGYHRYVSMFQAKAQNPEFNYPMELRITNFDTEKAQRMIYQMDQKTKMTKSVSDSYNVYAPQNKVVQRINESSMCNVCGFINRNNGKIDFSTLSECIKILYFPAKKSSDSPELRKEIIRVSKEFIDDFNILTETDSNYLEKIYTRKEIMVLSIMFHYYDGKNKREMPDMLIKILDNIDDLAKHNTSGTTKSNLNRIQKNVLNFMEGN